MFTGTWIFFFLFYFFKVWKNRIFSSTNAEGQWVGMKIYYLIQSRCGGIIKEIAHVKLHDNVPS